MTPWGVLPVVFLACLLGSWMSYHDVRREPASPYLFAFLGSFCAFLWGLAVARIGSPDAVYTFSLAWDAAAVLAYTAVPVVCGWASGDWRVFAGAVLVVTGAVLAKAGAA